MKENDNAYYIMDNTGYCGKVILLMLINLYHQLGYLEGSIV